MEVRQETRDEKPNKMVEHLFECDQNESKTEVNFLFQLYLIYQNYNVFQYLNN